MAAEPVQAESIIIKDRRFEDYRSLKQYFRGHAIEEFIYRGWDTSTATAAELQPDLTTALSYIGAEALVYARNQTDVEAQDGDTVYITYLNEAGAVIEADTELAIAGHAAGTAAPMPLGFEGYPDVVNGAPVAGAVTLTNLTATENEYEGMYLLVYSGDQVGVSSIILSNTADEGGVVVTTLKADWNANTAADLVSIQSVVYDDFFRLREMSFGVEGGDADNTWVCNLAGNAWYGIISDGNTKAAVPRYFAPAVTSGKDSKYFLGYIKAKVSQSQQADNDLTGYELSVTYTPKQTKEAVANSIPVADITLQMEFDTVLEWEPCIELEPATDVLIKVQRLVDEQHASVFLEYCFLEVDRID